MRFFIILFSLVGLLLIIFNIRVTVLVLYSTVNSFTQKILQLLLVWCVPFIGAVITHYVHVGKDRKRKEPWDNSDSWPDGTGAGFHFHN